MNGRAAGTHRPVLVHGGPIHTLVPGEAQRSWVLVENGRVRATGDGDLPAAPDAARVDLGGRLLLPGFCDAHAHLTWIATSLLGCDLSACDGVRSVLEALGAYGGPGRGPEGEWVVGYGFDESTWSEARLPTRADLDALEAHRPVLLQRVCGHVGVLNGRALARVPDGPHTNRDTGRIAEDDLYAVNDLLRPRVEDIERILPQVVSTLHAHGITSVHDVTSPEMLAALRRAVAAEGLEANVSCSIPARYLVPVIRPTVRGASTGARPDPTRFFADDGFEDLPVDRGDVRLRVLGVKLFVDGSLGARTAYLRDPYADDPTTRGVPLYEPAELAALVRRVDAAGLQLMVHAIGDAALDLALDALEPVLSGGNPHRHRLEHVEVTPPDLVERLARSGVRACVQPNFAGRWSHPGGMNAQRLGDRLQHCNAYRTLHSAGVPLAFGSDCMPLGPLFGLRSAVAHPLVQERLDAATAMGLYTAAGANITHADAATGRIAPGLQADLVVLEGGLPESAGWEAASVVGVFVRGRQVSGNPL